MASSEQTELLLFIENDGTLYRQRFVPIIKNLQRKKKKGIYKNLGGVKAFLNLVVQGAKKYAKDFARPQEWNTIFSTKDRLSVARELEKQFSRDYASGERL